MDGFLQGDQAMPFHHLYLMLKYKSIKGHPQGLVLANDRPPVGKHDFNWGLYGFRGQKSLTLTTLGNLKQMWLGKIKVKASSEPISVSLYHLHKHKGDFLSTSCISLKQVSPPNK